MVTNSAHFAAGAAAVLMSARASEGLSVAQIKGLLSTTSQIYVSTQNPASALVTVPLQGSGTSHTRWRLNTRLTAPSQA